MTDCNRCVWARRDGGCNSWECEFIDQSEVANRKECKEGVESHSEKDILEGCIALLNEMVGYFSDYMEWLGYEPNEEERACGYFGMSYFKIVKRLFLWETKHSGGTSTCEKCYELGIDEPSDGVRFALWDEEDGEAE